MFNGSKKYQLYTMTWKNVNAYNNICSELHTNETIGGPIKLKKIGGSITANCFGYLLFLNGIMNSSKFYNVCVIRETFRNGIHHDMTQHHILISV